MAWQILGEKSPPPIETKPETPPAKPPEPTVDRLDVALNITGEFEGKGFGQVTGNFDGMGISCGILQWNYGMESLQGRILRPYIARHGSIDALGIFPGVVDKTAQMGASAAVAYAKSNMLVDGAVKPIWKAAWGKFMTLPEVVALQKEACAGVANSADKLMKSMGFDSLRAFCWFYDIVTENGGMKATTHMAPDRALAKAELAACKPSEYDGKYMVKNQSFWPPLIDAATDESVSLLRMSIHRAKQSRPEFFSDVTNRKGAIALGKGWVHGGLMEYPELG